MRLAELWSTWVPRKTIRSFSNRWYTSGVMPSEAAIAANGGGRSVQISVHGRRISALGRTSAHCWRATTQPNPFASSRPGRGVDRCRLRFAWVALYCGRGEIGRRAGFRSRSFRGWRFKSSRPHKHLTREYARSWPSRNAFAPNEPEIANGLLTARFVLVYPYCSRARAKKGTIDDVRRAYRVLRPLAFASSAPHAAKGARTAGIRRNGISFLGRLQIPNENEGQPEERALRGVGRKLPRWEIRQHRFIHHQFRALVDLEPCSSEGGDVLADLVHDVRNKVDRRCSVVFGLENGLSAEHRERWVYVGQNDPTTRTNHASKFSHDGVEVIDMCQRQRTHHEVHAFVRKWERFESAESRASRIGSFFLATANIS